MPMAANSNAVLKSSLMESIFELIFGLFLKFKSHSIIASAIIVMIKNMLGQAVIHIEDITITTRIEMIVRLINLNF
jgi:hypothetical protein